VNGAAAIAMREGHARFAARADLPILLLDRAGAFAGGRGLHRMDWAVPPRDVVVDARVPRTPRPARSWQADRGCSRRPPWATWAG
jgi:hypothetical protein